MDRRSWLWKKKSSEKDVSNITNYVQISAETYANLIDLEDQVKILNEKLSAAENEITTKDNLVKQHVKVSEEAILGWEKAEAESSALKNQLESVTLLKLTAEERASHLDGALKECMKQIRNVKEESEQKLHDVVFAKTKQWEKVKAGLEEKLTDFEQELLRASAENDALSRSLQERSDILMEVNNQKMEADTEIELLKINIQSCEKEIRSLKYELHVISKELEIRNEEKSMSIKSADVTNKQHLEDVKKISKLEAECQRLRCLVRKKLPGPAALAQMKLEVENLGRDNAESKLRRSPSRNPSLHLMPTAADYASDSIHSLKKENEFLTARLYAIEEETKMLTEALSERNGELQITRSMFAKTASRLQSVEAQFRSFSQHKISPKPSIGISFDSTLRQYESNPRSFTSTSEDGTDVDTTYSESLATTLLPDQSQFSSEKETNLELMDDFLEMEKLACLTSRPKDMRATASSHEFDTVETQNADVGTLDVQNDNTKTELLMSGKRENGHFPDNEGELERNELGSPLVKLQSRIVSIFESLPQDIDAAKVLDDIRYIIQDTQEKLLGHSVSCVIKESNIGDASCEKQSSNTDMDELINIRIYSEKENNSFPDDKHFLNQEVKNAISEIQNFVLFLGKEAAEPQYRSSDVQGLSEKIQQFSHYVKKIVCNEESLSDLIGVLSEVLSEASKLGLRIIFGMRSEWEGNSSDCIDKVTLLENGVTQQELTDENVSGNFNALTQSSSHPEIEGPNGENCEERNMMTQLSLEEVQQMRIEKEKLQVELSTYTELLEATKTRLIGTEQRLEVLKSELAASQKSNSLSETQLKCMTVSYNLLESHTNELEAEVDQLHIEVQTLNNEPQVERELHQDDLAKLKELQEKTERTEQSTRISDSDADTIKNQEKDIAAATEKLVECQETILLLGRQLQALRPPTEKLEPCPNTIHQMNDQDAHVPVALNKTTQSVPEAESTPVTVNELLLDGPCSPINQSDAEASHLLKSPLNSKLQKHRSPGSSSPNAFPEKHGRGFSRFFSKGKGDN
ncbi:filament-like plant protein 4 [Zingiber officinale]|uniref:filament-like plant protein 4 n=1 Tax=Zingiber officinale TaxID=94328 RepID=UPI001C4C913F|nr:filament-like plant protein 4 [Zingiber officinale]XP_042389258.1 filament-like plant protein 4 [Zingiber officinale]